MFYDVDLLTRGGKFAVIWLASSGLHMKDGKIKAAHRREALNVNVLKTMYVPYFFIFKSIYFIYDVCLICVLSVHSQDLKQYIIPNSDPNAPSQFSLYLAARLCHGTIAIHAFQAKQAVSKLKIYIFPLYSFKLFILFGFTIFIQSTSLIKCTEGLA